jgi:hypothetical protein
MKKFFTSLLTIFFIININAQDIILKQDGSKVECKIKEISSSAVKYLKLSDLEGPVFIEEKSNLIGVLFENGDFDKFSVSMSKANKKFVNDKVNLSYLTLSSSNGFSVSYESFTKKHFSWNVGFTSFTNPGSTDLYEEQYYNETDFLSINLGIGTRFYTRDKSGIYGGATFIIGFVENENNSFRGLGTMVEVGRQFELSELFGLHIGYNTLLLNYSSVGVNRYFIFDSYINLGVNFTF